MTGFAIPAPTLPLFLSLAFASSSSGAERKIWLHPGGHFEVQPNGRWQEEGPGGAFAFVEKERAEKYVELFDQGRDCTVRLYGDRCEGKFKDGPFEKFYAGSWRPDVVELAGVWDSDWGNIALTATPGKDGKTVAVGGSFRREGNRSVIQSGTFTPATGLLEIAFEEPKGDNRTRGTAKLILDIEGNHLKGKYSAVDEKKEKDEGELTLTRLRGKDFPSRLNSLLAAAGVHAGTPGAAVLVLEHNKPIFKKAFGLADVGNKRPFTPQTTCELASCSKQFTGAAILRLAERGKLSPEDDARKYLPELPEYDRKNPIRILDLARHTSGLPEYMDFPDVKGKHPKYLSNGDYVGEFARRRKKFPLLFKTGSEYRYTNTNFLLLALIVERVSGQPFGTFLKAEYFDPFGMKTAGVYERPTFAPRDPAIGYHREKYVFEESWGAPPYRHESQLAVGDGGVWASLDDLTAWDEAWRKGKVLKVATIDKYLVPSKYGKDQTTDYAFGWVIARDDRGRLSNMGHNGSWGSFLSIIDRDVAADRTTAILTNTDSVNVDAILRLVKDTPPKGKE